MKADRERDKAQAVQDYEADSHSSSRQLAYRCRRGREDQSRRWCISLLTLEPSCACWRDWPVRRAAAGPAARCHDHAIRGPSSADQNDH